MKSYFVFDVESIGLHGEGYAVGGGVYLENGSPQWEFRIACLVSQARGAEIDRKWININVPPIEVTHSSLRDMRDQFWANWIKAKKENAMAAADCGWPVEAGFLSACVADDPMMRSFDGPYPFIEISTMLIAAGMNPMLEYHRTPSEMPKHDPLADARQSARLLAEALKILS